MLDTLTTFISAGQSGSQWVNLQSHRPRLFYVPAAWKVDTEIAFNVATKQPGPFARLCNADGSLFTLKPRTGTPTDSALIVDPAMLEGATMLQVVSVDASGEYANQDARMDITIKAT